MSRARSLGVIRAAFFVAVVFGAAGCAEIRAFLIPPPSHAAQSAAPELAPDLIIDHVRLPGAATVVSLSIRAGRVANITPGGQGLQVGTRTIRYDVADAVAVPSSADAHVHLAGAAMLTDAASAAAASTPGELCRMVAELGGQHGGAWRWVVGVRAEAAGDHDADSLEACAPGVAVVLSAPDGHGLLLSAAAVMLLPRELQPVARQARGRLRAGLGRLAWRSLPPPRRQRLGPLMVRTLAQFAERGVGEVHAMGESVHTLRILQDLERSRRLPIRVRVYLDAHDSATPAAIAKTATADRNGRKALVQLAGVKVWLDGTLGGKTAALTDAVGADGKQGSLELDDAQLRSWIERCDQAKLQLAVHAIGDAALDQLLRVVDGMRRPADALPIRIEHAQVVRSEQLAKLRGLLCSIQPAHRHDDLGFAAARLRSGHLRDGWRAASLAATCPLLLGSDLPVSAADPQRWLADLTGVLQPARAPGERLVLAEALDALRRDPATGRPRRIAVGKPADLVVWRTSPHDGTRPLMVVVDGVVRVIAPEILHAAER